MKQIDISRACEFLKSKFNGEIQRLYGADECARLLAEFGEAEYQRGDEEAFKAIERFEYNRQYDEDNN